MLRTYLLKGDTLDLRGQKKGSKAFALYTRKEKRKSGTVTVYGDRAIVVTSHPPPKRLVVEKFDGNQLEVRISWLESTVLNDLHTEYKKAAPIPARTQRAAIDGLLKADRELAKALKAVDKAKKKQRQAAARIVRTHGKAPVVIKGVTYDPSCRRGYDEVWLVPRVPAKGEEK
jgi:hypothetical protein